MSILEKGNEWAKKNPVKFIVASVILIGFSIVMGSKVGSGISKSDACNCLEIVDNYEKLFETGGISHAKEQAECYEKFSPEPYRKYTATEDWKKQLEHARSLQPRARERMLKLCDD